MNLTAWVDVALGLTLVYLGASLFVTVINEHISQMLNLRGKQLSDSLKKLFDDTTVQDLLSQSPALKPLFDAPTGRAPSYVDTNILARLLVGGLAVGSTASDTVQRASAAIEKLAPSELKSTLQALVASAGSTTDNLVSEISDWTDNALTVLGEKYKRNLQTTSLILGVVVAVGLNIDTVALTAHLYRDKDARDALAALAVQITEKTSTGAFDKCMALSAEELRTNTACAQISGLVDAVQGGNDSLGKLPIGWSGSPDRPASVSPLYFLGSRLLGWLLTALALSLGAPFWFDLLGKVADVRQGMRKPKIPSK